MLRTWMLLTEVTYDDEVTDPKSLAVAADRLLDTALSTPGILDDYASDEEGSPVFSEFTVSPDRDAVDRLALEALRGVAEVIEMTYGHNAAEERDDDAEPDKSAADIFEQIGFCESDVNAAIVALETGILGKDAS